MPAPVRVRLDHRTGVIVPVVGVVHMVVPVFERLVLMRVVIPF